MLCVYYANIPPHATDCVVYSVKRYPRESVTKTFHDRLRLSIRAPTTHGKQMWSARLNVLATHSQQNCSFELQAHSIKRTRLSGLTQSNNHNINGTVTGVIRGYCSKWNSLNNAKELSINTNFITFQDWTTMTIGMDQMDNFLIISTHLEDVEIIRIPNSGLEGELLLSLETEEEQIDVMFDCESGKINYL